MKNTALALNIVLLVAVGVLFYLHFSSNAKAKGVQTGAAQPSAAAPAGAFKIGYFEWDSVTNNFTLFKQMQDELNEKDEANNKAKNRMRQMYQTKINSYNKQMSQTESEAATQEVRELEMKIQGDMQKMDQDMQRAQMQKTNEVKSKIEEFLKEYNKEKGFSYVLANEPNLIFYKDSVYNITADLIKGLNEKYPKK